MSRLLSFTRHEISCAYLHLDKHSAQTYVVNMDNVTSIKFDPKYPNGYGDLLSKLTFNTIDKGKIELYREDADEVWKVIKEVMSNDHPLLVELV